jgi:hypothetical protein
MNTPVIATYGHGTENDFVIIFDPNEEIDLTSDQVANICNRDQRDWRRRRYSNYSPQWQVVYGL